MMNVVHLYDRQDRLIAQHVAMLEAHALDLPGSEEHLAEQEHSIVHVHGCWNRSIVRQALRLRRQGARIVLSPHGHLEPWIISQQRMTEKTAKILLWQKRLVAQAYTLIAHSKMEAEALRQLSWNPRIETIGNAVITNTFTPEAMTRQTEAVYQKVMDSNTVEHMTDDTLQLMGVLLKAGITGDRRWMEPLDSPLPSLSPLEMRRLLLYADHENIREHLDRGIRVMGIHQPNLDTTQIPAYFPEAYRQPSVSATDVVGIAEEAHRDRLTMHHVVAMAQALRRPDADDELIEEALADKHLTRYFQRLLQILQEQLLQEEGFLPLPPIDDRQTQQLRNQLSRHLRI